MDYNAILLEMMTVILGIGLLAATLLMPRKYAKTPGYLSVIGLAVILITSISGYTGKPAFFSGRFFINDGLSVAFKQVFLISAILVAFMGLGYSDRIKSNHGEFFAINVFALAGMMAMVSANDFISLYVGLELMTISFIILTAFDREDIKSTEAGLKYIFLSAISSAVLLYGMSMIYGMSGSLVFPDILNFLGTSAASPVLIIAVIMVIVGFAFKVSAVPFHMWTPDVYEGAPTPTSAFLAIGSKAAGFAVLIRILFQVLSNEYSMFISLIVSLAVLTMVVGNLIAIPQTNIKRLLAYSSIAQAGYILLGVVAYTQLGVTAMLFYILLYAFTNAGAFASVIAIASGTGSYEIKDFAGMWKKSPLISTVFLISLLSLAGIPPTAGFTGKFFLLTAVMKQGYMWLALLAIGMSVVSVYYYILVIRTMLMGEPDENLKIKVSFPLKLVMAVSVVMILLMGIYPTPFMNWAGNAVSMFLSR